MREKKTTIYDLAQELGASPSTVSAVLNGTWKARRIKEATAEHILKAATESGYSANLQARGLRKSRSGLIGMIIPMHHNRYFGTLSHEFELEARKRGLCPVIVSTLRNPDEERRTVEQLVSYNVESIAITGATDPDAISRICTNAGIRHVNIDLPGTLAPSVISDNFWGAAALTDAMVNHLSASRREAKPPFFFIGGTTDDYATRSRIEGFKDIHIKRLSPFSPNQIRTDGYDPIIAESTVRKLYDDLGGLPSGLFVNSMIAFEGVVRFLKTLNIKEINGSVIGCYDWDPFAESLHFPVIMARQKTELLVSAAFKLLDEPVQQPAAIVEIKPEILVSPILTATPDEY